MNNQNLKSNILLNDNNEFEPVDYLIVTSEEMLSQAERLAQINREVNGLNVKVVVNGTFLMNLIHQISLFQQ